MKQSGSVPNDRLGMVTFQEGEIREETDGRSQTIGYGIIEKVAETPQAIYVYFNAAQAFMLPARLFASGEERGAFLHFLREEMDKAKQMPGGVKVPKEAEKEPSHEKKSDGDGTN